MVGNVYIFFSLSPNSPAVAPYLAHERIIKQGLLFRADKSDDVYLPLHSEHTHCMVSGELLFDRLAPQRQQRFRAVPIFGGFAVLLLPEIAYAQH